MPRTWHGGGATSPRPARPRLARLRDAGLRLRLTLLAAFALIALAVVAHGLTTLRLDEQRRIDDAFVDAAGRLRAVTRQVDLAAVLTRSEPSRRELHAAELDRQLARSKQETQQLERTLGERERLDPAGWAQVAQAQQRVDQARELLWYRGHALLSGIARSDDDEAVGALVAELREAADALLTESMGFTNQLRKQALQRQETLRQRVRWGLAGLLLLLAGLALVAVEPAVRAMRRQARRLEEQAADLRRLALVAEHTSALVVLTDADDRIEWCNEAFVRATGWSLADAGGRRTEELLAHPGGDTAAQDAMVAAAGAGRGHRAELLRQRRDGGDLWLDVDLRPLHDEAGALRGLVRVATDVTARVQQQQRQRAIWATLPAGVVVRDTEGRIVDWNPMAARLLGLRGDASRRGTAFVTESRVTHEDGRDCPPDETPAMRALRSGRALNNVTMGVAVEGGPTRWLLVNAEPLFDMQGGISGAVSCFSDVTESRELQQRLHASARTDALTRLPNRSVVLERLEAALAHARRHPGYGFALLFMDFDRFKQVNDTLGHSAGDELLRQIAGRLQLLLRPGDAVARVESETRLAARLGGDEFVVVLEGVSVPEQVQAIAERLQRELSEPFVVGATPLQCTASIGIVLSNGVDDAEEMLRNADTAMYEAKRAGKARCVLFDRSMHERVVRTLAIEADLRAALQRDELFVVYQPVIDLGPGGALGVEALVRWRHPARGVVMPADFIAVAEDCGLIDALGERVLRKACAQFVAWRGELGAAAPQLLAVNLSRAQLQRPALAQEVHDLLRQTGMPPAMLQLEVTESLAAQDERVQGALGQLKALGVQLALDDFGTGYSSLACLHQLPVDTVKIDRSFVRHAETVEYHRVLIEATIRVSRTLGMRTVAEGIETEGQAQLMRELNCDRGQGYLYSRPLEPGALRDWALARDTAQRTLDALRR